MCVVYNVSMKKQNNSGNDPEYQAYLETLHQGLQTDEQLLDEVVFEVTAAHIKDRQKIVKGEMNEVYSIVLNNGREIIVRISRSDHGDWSEFEREKLAFDLCKDLNLPFPNILAIKKREENGQKKMFCLEDKIQATPLVEQKDLPEDQRYAIVVEAGKLLKKIHSIKREGYGWLQKDGTGQHKSFQEYMNDFCQKERYREVLQQTGFSKEEIEKIFSILKTSFEDTGDYCLLHHDYHPKHLLVQGGRIKGIIDMGNARGGFYIEDLTWWDFFVREGFPTEWLLEGYFDGEVRPENFDDQFHYHQLLLGVMIGEWYDSIGHHMGLEHSVKMIKKDLEYFK